MDANDGHISGPSGQGPQSVADTGGGADAGTPLVTVSIGLATCAEDASDYDGLFECADRRLYLAKSAGRNRVIGGDEENHGALRTAKPLRA